MLEQLGDHGGVPALGRKVQRRPAPEQLGGGVGVEAANEQRGGLLKVCGWAMVAPVAANSEPWVLGGVFFFFILGAASTKDFSDMDGDRQGGVVTLPIRFGARRAAWMMSPFYVVPWMVFAALPHFEVGGRAALTVDPFWGTALGCALAVHGLVTAVLMVRHASDLIDHRRGRYMWVNLYVLMMEAQVGVAVLYLL